MPILQHGAMPLTNKLDFHYSLQSLYRDFIIIGELELVSTVYTVLFHRSFKFTIVVDMTSTNQPLRRKPILKLDFKDAVQINCMLPFQPINILQVDSVATRYPLQSIEIASTVYKMLVNNGYILLSDNLQFDPGANLWKKLARECGDSYKVLVIDSETGAWRDGDGRLTYYDGTNIQDDALWSLDTERQPTIFALIKR